MISPRFKSKFPKSVLLQITCKVFQISYLTWIPLLYYSLKRACLDINSQIRIYLGLFALRFDAQRFLLWLLPLASNLFDPSIAILADSSYISISSILDKLLFLSSSASSYSSTYMIIHVKVLQKDTCLSYITFVYAVRSSFCQFSFGSIHTRFENRYIFLDNIAPSYIGNLAW